MTADVVPFSPDHTVAALGLAGWLGTVSPHTARAYEVDLRQFTAWIDDRNIAPETVTPGVTTVWLADLAAGGQVGVHPPPAGHRQGRETPQTAVLPAPAVVAVHDWLEQRGDTPGSLFATSTGAALDPRAAHRLIGRLGDRAGIARLHPHTLRHTFATSADAGADVLKVATALGHASPSTTMRYVRGRDVITGSPVHAVAAAIVTGRS